MFRYVAFLRGINVGGRSVKKETLQKVFLQLGFEDVSTFKQSGNVIFQSAEADEKALTAHIEAALKSTLGYDVPVFLRTLSQLNAIIQLDAFKGQNAQGASFLVTFLSMEPKASAIQLPITIPKSTAQVILASGREIYSVTHGGGEGALPNPYVEKQLKAKATTRNLHVISEIAEKYS